MKLPRSGPLHKNLAKEPSVSSQDITAAPYTFQDDPYLIPTTTQESVSTYFRVVFLVFMFHLAGLGTRVHI